MSFFGGITTEHPIVQAPEPTRRSNRRRADNQVCSIQPAKYDCTSTIATAAMSFFGGGQPQQPQGPDPIFAAKTEVEMYTDLFNKISSSCFQKCSSRRHRDQDLTLGEMACTDRCVAKYLDSQQLVGAILQKANEAQLQQQQQMQAMNQQFGG
mmetsp:Transcript_5473/g.14843  ORF Transcript_5473/g.14843 Transcript_5473/m.14843 type:complete len:153 (-) Transcript_5473:400-858(-)